MKRVLLLLPLLAIGCQAPVTQYNIKNLNASDSVNVQDLRPETEKIHEIFSINIVNDAYGIAREGDAHTNPLPIRLLQHRVYEKLGGSGVGLELKVYHFVIYSNATATFKANAERASASAAGATGGTTGAAMYGAILASAPFPNPSIQDPHATMVDRKSFEALQEQGEYKRGFYSQAENPSKSSAVMVYIDADINGKRIFIREFTPHGGESYASSPDLAAAINKSVDSGIQAFLAAY